VILVLGVYVPVKMPIPLLLLAAVLPEQRPPVSVATRLVAVILSICVVFVKSQVPMLVCGPTEFTEQPATGTVAVQSKPESSATVPVAEGDPKLVSLSVMLPLHA
jgi:hypothetical protein